MSDKNILAALEIKHDHLDSIIRASEGWAPVFLKTPKQHAELVKIQNRLERKLRRYFRDLSKKSASLVNWNKWYQGVMADDNFDVVVELTGEIWQSDATILIGVLYDQIAAGVLTGAQATEELYSGFLGVSKTSGFVQKAAYDHAGELIRGLQETTRRDVARSIQTSIKLGENQEAAVKRLMDYIDDPVRARMIARTEAVRAYNTGIMKYAQESGAETKTWNTLGGGCSQICATIDLSPIALNDEFNGDGGSYDFPPAHPNCQCSVTIGYAKIDSAGNVDEATNEEGMTY
jgi:hypothetical protein